MYYWCLFKDGDNTMTERMTWDEISKQYPDQWVGLVDIDWEDEANIKSAVVRYIGLPSSELVRIIFHLLELWGYLDETVYS